MAESGTKDKPNLKICIDNTEQDSEDEASVDLSDSSDSGEDEKYSGRDTEDDCVEFNVRIGKTNQPPSAAAATTRSSTTTSPPPTTPPPPPPEANDDTDRTADVAEKPRPKFEIQLKKYEKRSGEFIADMTEEQLTEKKKERAKRFGIEVKSADSLFSSKQLYESLGIKEDDKHDERGVRAEAIHIRGLDDMNTQDIFKYFLEFGPGTIEWIDDTSCNVVWMDKVTAARAMLKLSRSQTSIQKYLTRKKAVKQMKGTEKEESVDTEDSDKETVKLKAFSDSKATTEDEDDELDLTEGFEESGSKSKKEEEATPTDSQSMDTSENIPATKQPAENTPETESQKPDTKEMEEGEISDHSDDQTNSDSCDEASFDVYKDVNLSHVIFPPGQWRLGVPYRKAKYIYFRFATKADKKLPGAEKRSKFYVRYGNPNHGGMTGLISKSRKRQHWQRRRNDVDQDDDDGSFTVKAPSGRVLPDYSDVAMFTDNVAVEDKDDFDRKPNQQPHSTYGSEGEEWEEEEDTVREDQILSEDEDLYKTNEELQGAVSEEEEDTRAMELELQKLLAAPKRSRRMHADDLEEEIKAKAAKRSDDPDDLQVIADIRDRITSTKRLGHGEVSTSLDARQLITGKAPDLRRRLESKRKKQDTSERSKSKYHALRIKVVD